MQLKYPSLGHSYFLPPALPLPFCLLLSRYLFVFSSPVTFLPPALPLPFCLLLSRYLFASCSYLFAVLPPPMSHRSSIQHPPLLCHAPSIRHSPPYVTPHLMRHLEVLKQVQNDNWGVHPYSPLSSIPNLFRKLFLLPFSHLLGVPPLLCHAPSIRCTPLLCHAALDAASRLKNKPILNLDCRIKSGN